MQKDNRAPAKAPATGSSETPAEEAEAGEPATLLELILAAQETREATLPPVRIDGVIVGRLTGFGAGGEPLVSSTVSPAPAPARAMAALAERDVGRDVALLFEGGDPGKPVVMGLMHDTIAPSPSPSVETDGERLVFTADKEIVLRCGDASITLTRAGKILIRGAYLLSRSSGVNRIQGGSVQIN